MPLSKDVDLVQLAEKTQGFGGADIAGICREAAMNAIRRQMVGLKDNHPSPEVLGSMTVSQADFEAALKIRQPFIKTKSPQQAEDYEKSPYA